MQHCSCVCVTTCLEASCEGRGAVSTMICIHYTVRSDCRRVLKGVVSVVWGTPTVKDTVRVPDTPHHPLETTAAHTSISPINFFSLPCPLLCPLLSHSFLRVPPHILTQLDFMPHLLPSLHNAPPPSDPFTTQTDLSECFFVGDADGSAGAHSNSDRCVTLCVHLAKCI